MPVDGAAPGFDALALACAMTRKQKGKVYAVYIIEVERSMALDAELESDAQTAEAVLQEAEAIAEKMDASIEGEILQARDAAHAIVDEAVERGVSAIVVGVDYEMPLGEFELGRKAKYVIDHAPCQVIVVREAARGVSE
ncbi:MAG TPA: universal stress protein [Dehalococcoidia bacterium]|nr:universal stress protein [Dehalococcoidia bacterium]